MLIGFIQYFFSIIKYNHHYCSLIINGPLKFCLLHGRYDAMS